MGVPGLKVPMGFSGLDVGSLRGLFEGSLMGFLGGPFLGSLTCSPLWQLVEVSALEGLEFGGSCGCLDS